MKMQDIKTELREGKKTLAVGAALMLLAAALVLCVLRFDAVWGCLRLISSALAPLLCGIVIAYVLNVFVHFFEDFVFRPLKNAKSKIWLKAKRPLAVLLAYLIVLLVIAFIAFFIIPGVVESMSVLGETLQKTLPETYQRALTWVTDFAQKHDLTFVQDFVKNINWEGLLSNLSRFTTDFVGSLVSVTVNVANAVFIFVMGFIFSVYMLFGKEKLLRGVKSTLLAFLPEKTGRKIAHVGTVANQVFFAFIKGQLTECVILGTLCYIGMSILGLDYALLISSIVALGALIPILGAYIGCISGVLILLLIHPIDALIFLIFLLCLQQLEGNLIYPRVVGSSIGLPPVWTLFAVLFWGGILGVPGILIGTPATAVLYRLLRTSVRERLREKELDPLDPRLSDPIPVEAEETRSSEEESIEEGEDAT